MGRVSLHVTSAGEAILVGDDERGIVQTKKFTTVTVTYRFVPAYCRNVVDLS